MYSPKIKEELIPKLYVLAKELGKPMTKLVCEIIEDYLNREDDREFESEKEIEPDMEFYETILKDFM